MGDAVASLVAVFLVLIWALTGPFFGFSSDWQLIINTGTTIVTFLMVFLIQNTQNRDSHTIHLKLNAIIDGFDQVREDMVAVEFASEEEIKAASEEFQKLREGVVDVANEVAHLAEEAGTVAAEAGNVAEDVRELAANAGAATAGAATA